MAKNYLHFENWEHVSASNEAELESLLIAIYGEIFYDKTDAKYIWFENIFEHGLALNFEPNFEPERLEDWGICYFDWDSQGAIDNKGIIIDHEIVKTLDLKPLYGDLKAQKELIISELIAEIKRVLALIHKHDVTEIDLDEYIDWTKIVGDYNLKSGDIAPDQLDKLENILLQFINQNK